MKIIYLDGNSLTFSQVEQIAGKLATVEITEEAYKRAENSRRILDACAKKNLPIYGYNRGVGWNKDKHVFEEYFHRYNQNLIYAHCVSVDPPMSVREVRSAMLIRLNTALCGGSGLSPHVLTYYREFINRDIVPVVPKRGSVGQADITSLSHIGLAFMGEGMVFYQGEKIPAIDAMKAEHLSPIVFGPKDGLGIVLSNAQSAAMAALLIMETERLTALSNLIYALGLEGLKGLVCVFDETANRMRGFEGQMRSAAQCRDYLSGSYLYEIKEEQQLYDSLSFGDGAAISGTVYDSIEYVRHFLLKQLNSTDDNPCVIPEENRVLLACPNFEPTTWVIGVEMLSIALSHLSKAVCQRTITLANPEFTHLSRFLSPKEGEVIAYGTIQKTFTALDAEIRMYANPSSMDMLPVAGAMEDHATNSVLVLEKLEKILDDLRYILAIELLHAAQAIDLRKPKKLGGKTELLYRELRKEVSFLATDRCLSEDIRTAYRLIQSGKLYDLC